MLLIILITLMEGNRILEYYQIDPNNMFFPHRLVANAYVGCVHDWGYCYAKWYCRKDEIRVKTNAPEILRKELKKRIEKGELREPVCFGSISDPYQPIENKYQITREMVKVCDEL
jgi:DNA repair photolyase